MIFSFLDRRRFKREHRFAHSHMSDYIDEELAPPERRRLEDHVGMCPQCRRVLATLRRSLRDLRSLSPEPRANVADGVIERLRRS